jgi:hypothetical protein
MEGARGLGVSAAVVAWLFLSGSYAHAQVGGDVVPLPSASVAQPDTIPVAHITRGGEQPVQWAALDASTGLGATPRVNPLGSPASFDDAARLASQRTLMPAGAASTAGRRRSTGNKTLAVVIVATTGFFVGGYLGAAIEGRRCACDDPGMLGAMIGAPIGAAAGAVVSLKLF